MKSWRSAKFRKLLSDLPKDVQKQANAAYRLFQADPFHSSLQFKRISKRKQVYSVRVGKGYRALGVRGENDEIVWYWIGSRGDYNKLLKMANMS